MKQAIIFRIDLKLGKGKLAAHAGHAALTGYLKAVARNPETVREWLAEGQKKIVLKAGGEKDLLALYETARSKRIPAELIRDAGLTQVEPGTLICIVIGPADDRSIDACTKDLKLL